MKTDRPNLRKLLVSFSIALATIAPSFATLAYEQYLSVDGYDISLSTLSDQEKLESLKTAILTADPDSSELITTYLDVLLSEAEYQKRTDYISFAKAWKVRLLAMDMENDGVFPAAEEAERYARERGHYEHLFDVQYIISRRYIDQGDYILGFLKARRLYEEAESVTDLLFMARSSSLMSEALRRVGSPDEAVPYSENVLEITRRMTDGGTTSMLRADAYHSLALSAYRARKYDKIMPYADSMLAQGNGRADHLLAKEIGRPEGYYKFMHGYLSALADIGTGRTAQAYIDIQSAESLIGHDWPAGFRQAINGIYAEFYRTKGDYQTALSYVERDIFFYGNLRGYLPQAVEAVRRKGDILSQAGLYKEANDAYVRAIEMLEQKSSESYIKQLREIDKKFFYPPSGNPSNGITLRGVDWFIIATIFILLLAIFCLIIYLYSRKIKNKNLHLYTKIQSKDIESEEMEMWINEAMELRNLLPDNAPCQDAEYDFYVKLTKLIADPAVYTDSNVRRRTIAEKLGTNEKTVYNIIKKYHNQSFSEYINTLRLNFARELLAAPDDRYTIEGIAIDSGFGSRYTFHRIFKEKYGLTPDEFRRLSQQRY